MVRQKKKTQNTKTKQTNNYRNIDSIHSLSIDKSTNFLFATKTNFFI